ncbi:hypothetical protein [Actinomadura rubrisoli]|uniref:Uncharacterized protein n=1 Tax=Actinomadura rubrisoli TaxID=2530368 RepID=A0A4R5CCS5_9ACTN|nr:hypothetical protein [Actinomadura rubrisoli]TDD96043.1 hypothetical protein E1298_03615 [Actinomadura rubrisoli]
MSDRPPFPPDEDALVLPAELRRRLHPRRGGSPGPRVTVDETAAKRIRGLVDEVWPDADSLRRTLVGPPNGWSATSGTSPGSPIRRARDDVRRVRPGRAEHPRRTYRPRAAL